MHCPEQPIATKAAEQLLGGPVGMAIAVTAGVCGDREQQWLINGLATWYRAKGAVSLQRCLGLPPSWRKVAQAERDHYVRMAAGELLGEGRQSVRQVCAGLVAELDKFMTRGAWPAWKGLDEPPPGTSRLRAALFHVARLNDGRSITARHVARILGETGVRRDCPEKCRGVPRTMRP